MKNVLKFLCLNFLFLLAGSQVSYADNMLDTVFDDGSLLEFQNPESRSIDSEELQASEGSGQPSPIELDPIDAAPISDILLDSSINTRNIIGSDNRKIVNNTTVNPYRKVVSLLITFPNGKRYIGSGNMISKDTVLTAGHCLYSKNSGGWAKSIAVYAGRNGNSAPYGVAYSKKLMTVKGWINDTSSEHDIGAIKLDRDIGTTVGWFGLSTVMSGPITLSGYHGDLNNRMGTETGNISSVSNNNVYYYLDSTGGSSGSGVYNNNQEILAVHAYGSSSKNFGTRINIDKFSLIRSWITGLNIVPEQHGINYNTHIQSFGWLGNVANGDISGSTGLAKRMEAVQIRINDPKYSGSIQYRVHGQTYGWQNWVQNGAVAGTTGQAKRIEAIQIKLTGNLEKAYHVEYRVHGQTYGWQNWMRNGAIAGTTGQAKRIEAIQIRLIKK